MAQRKPETLALTVALAGTLTVLLVFLGDLVLARHRDLESGERRLQHFGIMMAEHTARTFEALDVLLRETASDLSNNRRGWERWDASRGWEYIAQRHSRAMPQLRDLIIFDRYGNQRFISTYFPAPISTSATGLISRPSRAVPNRPPSALTSVATPGATPTPSPAALSATTGPSRAPSSPRSNRATCRISAGPTGFPTISKRC